jgi:hydrogenase maturation protease
MTDPTARLLVLGMGNDLLGDDAVGLLVARATRQRLGHLPGCIIRETQEAGLALLDEIVGCEHLVIADAIETGTVPPGHVHEFDADTLMAHRVAGPHFVGLSESLALGRRLRLSMPRDACVVAVEIRTNLELGAPVTPAVHHAVDVAAARIAQRVFDLLEDPPASPD